MNVSSNAATFILTLCVALGLHVSVSPDLQFALDRLPVSGNWELFISIPVSLFAVAILCYLSFSKSGVVISVVFLILMLYVFIFELNVHSFRSILNLVFLVAVFLIIKLPLSSNISNFKFNYQAVHYGLWVCFAVFVLVFLNKFVFGFGLSLGWVFPGIALYDFEQYVGIVYLGIIALLISDNRLQSMQIILLLISSFIVAYGSSNLTAIAVTLYLSVGLLIFWLVPNGKKILDVLSGVTWLAPIFLPLFLYSLSIVAKYSFFGTGMFTRIDIYTHVINSLTIGDLMFPNGSSYLGDPHNQFLSYILSFGIIPGILIWFYIVSLSLRMNNLDRFIFSAIVILPGVVLDLLSHLSTMMLALLMLLLFRITGKFSIL